MKNTLKITLAALVIAAVSSCIRTIDPQSSTVTDKQASNAPGAYDNFVNSITNSLAGSFTYSGSNNYPPDFGYPSFFLQRDVMGQDIVVEDASWYSSWYNCSRTLGPAYANCQYPWTYYYGWIKNCNTVISLYKASPSEDKVSGAGIAYAMRAMFYMDLARMFAQETYTANLESVSVPIVTESTEIPDLVANPRATNEKMFEFILEDLDKAEEFLADYVRADVYTPDLNVVYGLKARAYLTMGNWEKAKEYAVLAQEGYTSMNEAQYLDRNNGFNTPNSAWIFALTFKSTDENIIENDADSCWGSQMIIEVSESECGYAANYGQPMRIDQHLYSTIPATDFRKKCFVDFAIDEMDEADAIKALSDYSDVPEGLLVTADASATGVVGGLELKFRPKGGEHANQYAAFTVAVPLMRVEEMELIEIEALGRMNESEGVKKLTAWAQLRDPEFEYGNHRDNYYDMTSGPFVNEVWWQRRVELWGEGFATFDIKRLGKGIIRSYPGSNHLEEYKWNMEKTPDWMNLCIVQTETNYNSACTNNPAPVHETGADQEYVF